jgi:hypothetical protein
MIQKKKTGGITFSRVLRSRLRTVKAAFLEEAAARVEQGGAQHASGSVDLCTLPQRLEPQLAFEEPEEVRRQPVTLQNRPPTPFIPNYSCWGPPLSTSDPNYVPRRLISMSHSYREEAVRLNAHHTAESRVGAWVRWTWN